MQKGLNYLGYVMIDHTSVTMFTYRFKKKKKNERINVYWGYHGSYDPTKVEIYNCFIISSSV